MFIWLPGDPSGEADGGVVTLRIAGKYPIEDLVLDVVLQPLRHALHATSPCTGEASRDCAYATTAFV